MKIAILYYSKTGKTLTMAKEISKGMEKVESVEVGLFDIDHIDGDFLAKSKAVVCGTPTYLANTCWQWKKWFDESHSYNLSGKLGAVFATANYAQGGADVAITTILQHMLVKGMLVYSSGSGCGQPYIHLGAVALRENFEESKAQFQVFGQRIAEKTAELFAK